MKKMLFLLSVGVVFFGGLFGAESKESKWKELSNLAQFTESKTAGDCFVIFTEEEGGGRGKEYVPVLLVKEASGRSTRTAAYGAKADLNFALFEVYSMSLDEIFIEELLNFEAGKHKEPEDVSAARAALSSCPLPPSPPSSDFSSVPSSLSSFSPFSSAPSSSPSSSSSFSSAPSSSPSSSSSFSSAPSSSPSSSSSFSSAPFGSSSFSGETSLGSAGKCHHFLKVWYKLHPERSSANLSGRGSIFWSRSVDRGQENTRELERNLYLETPRTSGIIDENDRVVQIFGKTYVKEGKDWYEVEVDDDVTCFNKSSKQLTLLNKELKVFDEYREAEVVMGEGQLESVEQKDDYEIDRPSSPPKTSIADRLENGQKCCVAQGAKTFTLFKYSNGELWEIDCDGSYSEYEGLYSEYEDDSYVTFGEKLKLCSEQLPAEFSTVRRFGQLGFWEQVALSPNMWFSYLVTATLLTKLLVEVGKVKKVAENQSFGQILRTALKSLNRRNPVLVKALVMLLGSSIILQLAGTRLPFRLADSFGEKFMSLATRPITETWRESRKKG
ncbi:hypothetical protein ACFLY6_02700 [Candidatus Dependentiae bacterium]